MKDIGHGLDTGTAGFFCCGGGGGGGGATGADLTGGMDGASAEQISFEASSCLSQKGEKLSDLPEKLSLRQEEERNGEEEDARARAHRRGCGGRGRRRRWLSRRGEAGGGDLGAGRRGQREQESGGRGEGGELVGGEESEAYSGGLFGGMGQL